MKNSMGKIHFFKMLSSLVVWILVLVAFIAIGFSFTETQTIQIGNPQQITIKKTFLGWGYTTISDASNYKMSLKDIVNGEPLTKGLYALSIVAFVVTLLYFVYNTIIFGASFTKDNVVSLKTTKIVDALVWIIYGLFTILIIIGACQIKSYAQQQSYLTGLSLEIRNGLWLWILWYYCYNNSCSCYCYNN